MKYLPLLLLFALPVQAQELIDETALQAKVAEIETSLAQGNSAKNQLQGQIDQLRIDLDALTAELSATQAQHSADIAALRSELVALINALEARVAALENVEPTPEPTPEPDTPPDETEPPPDDTPPPTEPVDWVNECITGPGWNQCTNVPKFSETVMAENSFTDSEGTYTRGTRGDTGRTAGPTINLNEGLAGMFDAWVSFARDPATGDILIRGGGHSAYCGGDSYRFDMATGTVSRLQQPGRLKFIGQDGTRELWLPNGPPTGAHTYGIAVWHTSGKVLLHSGGCFYGYVAEDGTWRNFIAQDPDTRGRLKIFDPENLTWNYGPDMTIAYTPETSMVELPSGGVAYFDDRFRLSFYDVPTDTMTVPRRVSGASGVGPGQAVYASGKIYVRLNGIWEVDYQNFTARQLPFPAEIPESNPISQNYRTAWYDRSGLVVVGDNLCVLGAWTNSGRIPYGKNEAGRLGNFYCYDLTTEDITWYSVAGPELGFLSGKAYSLGNAILTFPAYDDHPWIFQFPASGEALEEQATIEHSLSSGPTAGSLQTLCDIAQDGDTLTVAATDTSGNPLEEIQGCGTSATDFTIRGGDPCPVVNVNAAGSGISGKGAFVIRGARTTLEDICIDGIAVGDGNGSAVRQEAPGLTLINVTVTNSQDGVLSGQGSESLTIDSSHFENVGGDCSVQCGRAHGTYFSSTGQLSISNSVYKCAVDAGHLVKSRAETTVIAGTVLDESDCRASRVIDISDCGTLRFSGGVIRKGAASDNNDVIGMCWESQDRPGFVRIDNSIIILVDRERVRIIGSPVALTVETADNIVIGHCELFDRWFSTDRGDVCYPDRASSGLTFDQDGLPTGRP